MRMVSAALLCFRIAWHGAHRDGAARCAGLGWILVRSDGPGGDADLHRGLVVYDVLFALDEQLNVHPQMVGAEDISADRLTY
jgi:hypothetical protein